MAPADPSDVLDLTPARLEAILVEEMGEPPYRARQILHGITREELNYVLTPMGRNGKEPVGSMGDDTPPAVLSKRG